ncbi:PadR family transcriptional regulator [Oscillospiraceae bacterium OttesenSCG-928-G22]|nr:PadR family transcriptional regulator [Oscillospiraceae bacterium OttesenSCG-928-G22]
MTREEALSHYLPMTETMYYILLSLSEPLHGYGVILHVQNLTGGRIRIGAGTVYNSIGRLIRHGLIEEVAETDRKKLYVLTDLGLEVLKAEIVRLRELYENGAEVYGLEHV